MRNPVGLIIFSVAICMGVCRADYTVANYDFSSGLASIDTVTECLASSYNPIKSWHVWSGDDQNIRLQVGTGEALRYSKSLAAALNYSRYTGFTVTPEEGQTLSCSSLSFDAAPAPDGDRTFTAHLAVLSGVLGYDEGHVIAAFSFPSTGGVSHCTVDLSGIAEMQAADSMVAFRIYEYFTDYSETPPADSLDALCLDNVQLAQSGMPGQGPSHGLLCTIRAGSASLENRVVSSSMLAGDWVPEHHHLIDFDALPALPVTNVVISDVSATDGVNQHNYLIVHDGLFWAMWSDGPGLEDRAGQVVKYSRSADGLSWDAPKMMTPYPNGTTPDSPYYNTKEGNGWRYISRGFWIRGGELYALAALDEAGDIFGPGLELHAFKWSGEQWGWVDTGVVHDNAINNFPPKLLPSGKWGMSRRTFDYKTSGTRFMVGGVPGITEWESFPVASGDSALKAEEPLWWTLPDENGLVALFRDNSSGGYLFRSFSGNSGRTWTTPVRTDFPDATSKVFGMRLSDGQYALVSNPKPNVRNPLALSLSADGVVFDRMVYLVGGRTVGYPHMIEQDGYLYIAHYGAKRTVEIERVSLADLAQVSMPAEPLETASLDVEVDGVLLDVETEGVWGLSSKADTKYADRYLYMWPEETGSVTFSRELPEAGSYEVFGWWNSEGNRCDEVPYVIQHAGGESTVIVDQGQQGGQWVSLGVYPFNAGRASVRVEANGFSSYVIAEAVRFVQQ